MLSSVFTDVRDVDLYAELLEIQIITVLIRHESDNHLSSLLCCVDAVSFYSTVLLNTVLMPF